MQEVSEVFVVDYMLIWMWCSRWGVSRSSTLRWAREAGVQRIHLPRPGHSQQFRDQVLETYRKKGLAAACREHLVDKLTVYK